MITQDNFSSGTLQFQDRQAGVSVVYSPEEDRFYYNVYCLEAKLLKELFSVEYDFLEDAVEAVNSEFPGWKFVDFDQNQKSGCGSCVAKR